MTKRSLIAGLLLCVVGFALPAAAPAQRGRRVQLGFTFGVSLLTTDAFAKSFNHGPNVSLMTDVPLVGRLSLRASVDREWLPYDRTRFFEQLGIAPVDLDGQLGGDARLTTWSVGPEVALWRTPLLRVYAFGAVGRVSRSTSTAPLVYLYCRAPGPGIDPEGCNQAMAETQVEGSGGSLAIGAGFQYQYRGRSYLAFEAGYVRTLLSPATDALPLRVGYGFSF